METGSQIVDHEAHAGRRSALLRGGFRFIFGLLLLALLSLFIDPEEILDAYRQAEALQIVFAVLLLTCNLGFQVIKWRVLLRLSDSSFTWKDTITSFMFGITAGTITPGQIGEFGGRAFRLQTDQPGLIIGLTIIDKLQVLGVMAIAGMWSLLFLFDAWSPLLLVLFSGITLAVITLLIRPLLVKRILEAVGLKRLRHRWIGQILESLSFMKSASVIATTLTMTVLFYGTVYVQTYFLLNAFSPIGGLDAFIGYAAMMFTKSLIPITLGDLGVREAGLVYFLSLRGIPEAASFNASILLFTINLLFPALCGLLFLPHSLPFRKHQ